MLYRLIPVNQLRELSKCSRSCHTSKHVKTLSFPQTSTETSSESDGDTEIEKIQEAFSSLELNRIHKPKANHTP
jgi:hypothetical protein